MGWMEKNSAADSLPYHDTKPAGYDGFYFALNATFRFIEKTKGRAVLLSFWQEHGMQYMAPIWQKWKEGGLPAIATYWKSFFSHEPGAEVEVVQNEECVELTISVCPAIKKLREEKREIFKDYCQHCYFVSEAGAKQAGHTVRIKGGNGSCHQAFYPVNSAPEPQCLENITLAQ